LVVPRRDTLGCTVSQGEKALPRHPATATAFDWDDHNLDKLLGRGIHDWNVEEVFANDPVFRRNKRSGTATWLMLGRDDGGRRLVIGIVWSDETNGILRAITAWDAR